MKVAVAGGGSVGMAVAADLKVHGHDVQILEVDPEQVARFQPHVDVRWVVADACEVSSLQAAGIAVTGVGRGEDFFRLEVEETEAHRPVAHDAFEMTATAATAEAFLVIE